MLTGAQNVTAQAFQAISQSPSAQVFNISVPSLETVISREVLWSSTVTIAITGVNKPVGEYLLNIGCTDSLAAFPLHSLCGNMSVNINNNTVSMNVADTLAPLLRLIDPEELAKYDCLTPTGLDVLGNYRDGVEQNPFTIGSSSQNQVQAAALLANSLPCVYNVINAANPIESDPAAVVVGQPMIAAGFTAQTFTSYPNNTLSYDMNRPAGSTWYHKPRGGWQLINVYTSPDGSMGANAALPLLGSTTVYVTFKVTEPLLISPFTFGCQDSKQGMYGIQNMTFQMNML